MTKYNVSYDYSPGDHVQISDTGRGHIDNPHATVVRKETNPTAPGTDDERLGYVVRLAASGDTVWHRQYDLTPPCLRFQPFAVCHDGSLRQYAFDNGYGALVEAQTPGRFEVSVLGADGEATYDTIGPNGIYQEEPEAGVQEILGRIAALPSARQPFGAADTPQADVERVAPSKG